MSVHVDFGGLLVCTAGVVLDAGADVGGGVDAGAGADVVGTDTVGAGVLTGTALDGWGAGGEPEDWQAATVSPAHTSTPSRRTRVTCRSADRWSRAGSAP